MSTLILVVEDDRAICQLVAQTLSDEGFEVLTAGHGGEALSVLATRRPSAIILDLNMPVMDGREFMRHLRADPRPAVRALPVLVLSAVNVARPREDLGADAAMSKPFDIDAVGRAVRRLLRRDQAGVASAAS